MRYMCNKPYPTENLRLKNENINLSISPTQTDICKHIYGLLSNIVDSQTKLQFYSRVGCFRASNSDLL